MTQAPNPRNSVGPVLIANAIGRAVAAIIQKHNSDTLIVDRGAYLRILVPVRCVLRADDVSKLCGETFELPNDLEAVMPAFQGRLRLDGQVAEWT